MPQLIPFYYGNLMLGLVATLAIVLFIVADLLLPVVLRLLVARSTVVQL
uniref:ATP synthase protein 8 n=1 Tax=Candida corydali TaxID=391826 RepID=S5TP32_9ASCO|nr:ATP synthase F0 subunit 8 [Candida corydali]AGS44550.1 ATP synthase F0 subunit 8 [Candida corydali]